MTISIRLRRDLVVIDTDRFVAAARDAYRELNPGSSETAAVEAVVDVHDAVGYLVERATRGLADILGPSATLIWPDFRLHEVGRGAPRPGSRITDRPDGLSPAGWLMQTVLDEHPLQDYGCFFPNDPFALPSDPDHSGDR